MNKRCFGQYTMDMIKKLETRGYSQGDCSRIVTIYEWYFFNGLNKQIKSYQGFVPTYEESEFMSLFEFWVDKYFDEWNYDVQEVYLLVKERKNE